MVTSRVADQRSIRPPHGAPRDVLVVGPGRSGTTWVAELLSRTAGTVYLHEPDGMAVPFAGRARAGLGDLPFVESDADAHADYVRLWDAAFGSRPRWIPNELARRLYSGARPNEIRRLVEPDHPSPSIRVRVATALARPNCARRPGRRLVKSVESAFALEWLIRRYNPLVVVVRRHPFEVIASWCDFWLPDAANNPDPVEEGYLDTRGVAPRLQRWGAPPSPPADDPYGELVWTVGLMMSSYQEVAESRPEVRVAVHEDLCVDPAPRFRRLVADLGLVWSAGCDEYLYASNAPGTGYETKRITAQQPGKWRTRLTEEQVRRAREILAPSPLARLYPDLQV